MKKIIAIFSVMLLLSAAVKIAFLNMNAERPNIQEFEMGTEVFYEDNYYEDSSEIRNGYSITVLSAKIFKTDDFLQEHQIKELNIPKDIDDPFIQYVPEYVFDVEVKVKNINNNNENSGIDLYNTILAADDFKLQVDDKIWSALYPQLNSIKKFKLVENSEAIIHFPYAISYGDAELQHSVTSDMLYKTDFQLVLSKYPVDMRINIHSDS